MKSTAIISYSCKCLLLLVALLFFSSGNRHAFYLSTFEIKPKEEQVYTALIKTYTDDLEAAIQNQTGTPVKLSPETWAMHQEKVGKYVSSVFQLKLQGQTVTLQLDSAAFYPDAVWTTYTFKSAAPIEAVKVKCTLFTELFEDQINAISFQVGEETRWLMLNKAETSKAIFF